MGSFLPGSEFDGVVTSITVVKTAAGTGSLRSYLKPDQPHLLPRAADGVLNLSVDSDDTPLPDFVSLANQLASTLGVG